MQLQNFHPRVFLKEHWQKKPLLIKQGLPNFTPPLSFEELMGLASEEDAETRIVHSTKDHPWQLQHGPFYQNDFEALAGQSWTLLVQALDHWLPEVKQLLNYFDFIPTWRVDDIMASYAPLGGGVGPHFDYYDVFLIQVSGQRTWQVGPAVEPDAELLPDTPLKILANMPVEEEWVLDPGDILYLPPQYAHNGVASSDECMTFSVGFRAPSHGDILSEFFAWQADHLKEQLRYQDPELQLQDQPGQIPESAIDHLLNIVQTYSQDRDALAQWFGQYMTEPKYADLAEDEAPIDEATLKQTLSQHEWVLRNEASRFAFNSGHLFVDGENWSLESHNQSVAETIASYQPLGAKQVLNWLDEPHCKTLLIGLFERGALYLPEEDD